MKYGTRCVKSVLNYPNGSDRPPIFMNNLYKLDETEFFYGRYNHFNHLSLSKRILALYDNKAKYCHIFNSGISVLHEILDDCPLNKEILVAEDVYREFTELIDLYKEKIKIKYINMHNINKLEQSISDTTYLIILESISNPLMDTYDIKKICEIAHNKSKKVLVDNTSLTSYSYNPFNDGADLVFESLSKYTVGHGDVFAGALLSNDNMYQYRNALKGNILPAFQCYLIERSLPTLEIRMERIIKTASVVYNYLKAKVKNIKFDGRNGLIVFVVGNEEANKFFINNLKMIFLGYSFGFEESVIITSYYRHTAHLPVPWNNHIRLSIGLENAEDIINDLDQAFKKLKEEMSKNQLKYINIRS